MYAITGASGFIGAHLENLLREKKIKYRKLGRKIDSDFIIKDINSKTNWEAALKGVDTIFHLAGRAHIKKNDNNSKKLLNEINFEGTKKLVEQASKMGVKKILDNKELRINMGKEARILAKRKFSINKVVEKHLTIYSSIL